MFFLNRSYCSSLFNENAGESFKEYLNMVRINRGKQLLKNTDHKISKIAKELGYGNDKYFFRIFKKVTGYTPEQYRKTLMIDNQL